MEQQRGKERKTTKSCTSLQNFFASAKFFCFSPSLGLHTAKASVKNRERLARAENTEYRKNGENGEWTVYLEQTDT